MESQSEKGAFERLVEIEAFLDKLKGLVGNSTEVKQGKELKIKGCGFSESISKDEREEVPAEGKIEEAFFEVRSSFVSFGVIGVLDVVW